MDRALPEYNRITHKKWLDYNKKIHRTRLQNTRAQVDNREPSSLNYPLIKLKKE